MKPEQWQQIERLYHAALEQKPDKRAAYVAEVCGDDASLRHEVEALLQYDGDASTFLNENAAAVLAQQFDTDELQDTQTLLLGQQLGAYQILAPLGRGGMGEVYLALDTRLQRKVALKLLPTRYTSDAARVRRFEQEARAASALNHPNILTIYDIGEHEQLHYIVTEYVDGETLRKQLLGAAPITLSTKVDCFVQIAKALSAAHEAGIIHRDIKPENVMVRRDGLVKVLDFGLAKLIEKRRGAKTDSHAFTSTSSGVVLGTPRYMSPEQARGEKVDARSDIFSFGVLLYEMLTGREPFQGATPSDVIAAILRDDPPPLSQHLPDCPLALEQIVNKALAKNRQERYQIINDLSLDLNGQDLQSALRAAGQVLHPEESSDQQLPLELATQPVPSSSLSKGERRQATIVCSNLSGYDALVEQFDPKEVQTLMDQIEEATYEIVERHGGKVNHFTSEAMVLLFGVPIAHEDDTLRSIRASLELQVRVKEICAEIESRLGQPIRLYAGINTGSVVIQQQNSTGKYMVTGDAIQTAERLVTHAAIDEILITPRTQRLIAPFYHTEASHKVPLKPSTPPVVTYRVGTVSGVHTKLEAAELLGLTQYTGRESELESLQTALGRAESGAGQFVTVAGDAGIGKSRLLLEFQRTLQSQHISILQGHCQAHRSLTPYSPFVDALKEALELEEGANSDQLRGKAVSQIRAIEPELEAYLPFYLHLLSLESENYSLPKQLRGDDLKLAILEALCAIFTLKTKGGPVVMMLEDWHWVDEGSEEALKRLLGVVSACPLMIVVTHRPERSFDWGYFGSHTALNLNPLGTASSSRIIRSLLGADQLPEGLGEFLHQRTGGNPFFIEEVCRTLMEEGQIQLSDGVATLSDSLDQLNLPSTVQAVIRTRLDRLDAATQEVLKLASVIGREFNRAILEAVLEPPSHLSSALEILQQSRLIQQIQVFPMVSYRFKHVLTQEVAYESLLIHQRKVLHEVVGTKIEELYSGHLQERLDQLVHHFSRAENWSKAVEYGLQSASVVKKLIRVAEALSLFEKAEAWLLKLPSTQDRKERLIEILLEQERQLEILGLRERQQELIDRVLSLLNPECDQSHLAEAYIRQGELHALLGRFDEAEDILNQSLEIRRSMADAIGERHALRSLGFLYWRQNRHSDAVACNEAALELDRELGDDVGYARDLTNLGSVFHSQGELTVALDYLKEALQILETMERPFELSNALGIMGFVYRDMGRLDMALDHYQRAINSNKQIPVPYGHWPAVNAMANIYWDMGNIEQCLRLYRELISQSRMLNITRELAPTLNALGQRLGELGKVEEALPYLQEAAEIFARKGEKENQVLALTNLSCLCGEDPDRYAQCQNTWEQVRVLHQELNDPIGELTALEGLVRLARRQGRDLELALHYSQESLELAVKLGDAVRQAEWLNTLGIIEWSRKAYTSALSYYERALLIFNQLGDQVHTGVMLNSIGVTLKALKRYEEAQVQLEEAVRANHSSGQQLLEGHALAALGDLFNETGSPDRARDNYQASLAIRREIGDRQGEGWMLHSLARSCLTNGQIKQGREFLEQASAIATELGSEKLHAACRYFES